MDIGQLILQPELKPILQEMAMFQIVHVHEVRLIKNFPNCFRCLHSDATINDLLFAFQTINVNLKLTF